jgi:hypothetical protein
VRLKNGLRPAAAKGVRFLKKVPDAPPAEDGPPWPTLKSTENFGLVGEIAKLATANSEADPIGVMIENLEEPETVTGSVPAPDAAGEAGEGEAGAPAAATADQ